MTTSMPGSRGLRLLALVLTVTAIPLTARAAEPPHPKLVVLISVDQLRGDLLERYQAAFTGGFKRLLERGYVFTQASEEHGITHTAAGHATLSTGVFPARSGIVANDWLQERDGEWTSMYAVADPDAAILDVPHMSGRSPKNLLRGGLADWIQAADPDAVVVSISGKDRAAITLAGKTKGQVYWIAPGIARFVTSTYYRTEYPDWVTRFNESVMPALWADSTWEEDIPVRWRGLSRGDTADYEGDGLHTAFPHVASQELRRRTAAAFNTWAYQQPRQDHAVLLLAEEAIAHLRLGQRGPLDFLAVSLSAADYIGHEYGPLSREQLDNLYRLDRELGALFDRLDATVGAGEWVVGLSADHGVMTAPEALEAMGQSARRLDYRVRSRAIRTAARDAAGEGGTQPEIASRLARDLEERGLVERAYTVGELTGGEPPDSFAALLSHSYRRDRPAGIVSRYGVEIRFGYHQLWRSSATGTDHGTPYWHDRWVPFILMGAGVEHGCTEVAVHTVDMAPTLASLAGIWAPGDLDGRVVY